MKLVPANREEVHGAYKKSENLLLLEEFINSGMDFAKLEELGDRSAYSVAASLRSSAKRYGFHAVTTMTKNGVVYLIKEDK